ncbi:DUF4142 domain-containing protein [Xanthomonas sp. NCPPB 1638]|uniref:Uncharacterized protein n=1 Tax=Xanthomonas cucurbitae TaxID=56453 RepID=A0A2S7DTN6_9XANT|nr:DUF4142 domain-containing protein [Xanthomonas cucurbitae]PPU77202.1 hypothetical protein XcuCFBP2542_06630 [Xanthomonas cucurbitae]QHG88500.1 DUF4142 domain-containing protein [Xanthomonas cucurbitae]WDM75076.1 DUF4142 domain-containing protein [Xanthomonas cucurbitae]WDM78783.1 DUF4142 domain-containing protein [Xanthomonas cucurbitae]WDM82462.1 DUF4142 domain-containing protein [Xanthomonas cucurbitae]
MGLLRMVTAGAVGYVAYKAWQRHQGRAKHAPGVFNRLQDRQDAARHATSSYGHTSKYSADSSPESRQALGALSVFNEQERALAQLAIIKGVDGPVLHFARKMDQAHSATLTDLSRFAPERGGDLGKAAAASWEAARKQLEQLQGRNFQTQYLKASVTSHEQALALLDTRFNGEPGSSDLGKALQRVRIAIAEHLAQAKALCAKQTQSH